MTVGAADIWRWLDIGRCHAVALAEAPTLVLDDRDQPAVRTSVAGACCPPALCARRDSSGAQARHTSGLHPLIVNQDRLDPSLATLQP
jgi:hypothetical protein